MHNIIPSSEISIIVQGTSENICCKNPLINITQQSLKQLRKLFPEAEIILSTWEGSNIKDLDYDKLILNKDPGHSFLFSDKSKHNNLNRQLLSTKTGLKTATRKFGLKIRSDILLNGLTFLSYFSKFNKRISDFKIFEKRILTCSIASRIYKTNSIDPFCKFLFHPSDWIHFGLLSDLKFFWDIPLAGDEYHNFFDKDPLSLNDKAYRLYQYAPEQYVWLNCLRKIYNIKYDHYADFSIELEHISRMTLLNNFVFLDMNQWPIKMEKYQIPVLFRLDFQSLYLFNKWLRDYKKYFDQSIIVPFNYFQLVERLIPYDFFLKALMLKNKLLNY